MDPSELLAMLGIVPQERKRPAETTPWDPYPQRPTHQQVEDGTASFPWHVPPPEQMPMEEMIRVLGLPQVERDAVMAEDDARFGEWSRQAEAAAPENDPELLRRLEGTGLENNPAMAFQMNEYFQQFPFNFNTQGLRRSDNLVDAGSPGTPQRRAFERRQGTPR